MIVPQDTYALLQYNMIHAHDTFKLEYDTIVSHLDSLPKDDLRNFLGYCEAWALSIELHHTSEEDIVFPFLNQKMNFSEEKAQHELIHANLDRILSLIVAAKADPTKFDSCALRDIMNDFKETLYTHLDEEVKHISASNLKTAQFEERDVKAMVERLETYAKSHGDPFLLVPFMRSHTPAAIKDTWPSMPWIVRKVVVPYVLAKKHSGCVRTHENPLALLMYRVDIGSTLLILCLDALLGDFVDVSQYLCAIAKAACFIRSGTIMSVTPLSTSP